MSSQILKFNAAWLSMRERRGGAQRMALRSLKEPPMGFAVWIDQACGVVWAQGTHEYRPMGAAAIAATDQFRPRDFIPSRRCPRPLRRSFAGFFGSLEEVNATLRSRRRWRLRSTPSHLW